MRISSKLGQAMAATALAATVLTGSAGVAAAAPNRGDGPKTEEQEHACLTAYQIMEWAKLKRQKAGDVYDRIANAAFDYIDQNCEGVDFPQSSPGPLSPGTKVTVHNGTTVSVATDPLGDPRRLVLNLQPLDKAITR